MNIDKEMKDICTMQGMLSSHLKTCFDKGLDSVSAQEAGEITDMIKDLAETKRNCAEAAYYESIQEAMEDYPEYDRYGYNPNRYANGRYAPTGKGRVRGFRPYDPFDDMGYLHNPNEYDRDRWPVMGYSQSPWKKSEVSGEEYPRYGKPYYDYQVAKKHYTTSHSDTYKDEMDLHAKEHIMDTLSTIRDIWKSADPSLKMQMKTDLTNLVGEMVI